ncbi:Phosphate acetyltransferase [Sporomusa silvacetica DSM 10669]|uniref:Phosphate acetyltransferase n=1 Tax=Sporomusa silvacetica DSM 10669 TaxID=1123289 RepID=A0ABZ3IV21_9FIRM|nr:bifunctional enoyl-CoA hydratase/phosphate acetyltransferase [Sporomusa silvacetica]OZC14274.1 phosphate acetyltransferase [Sporomusa silvacetica DSM 10669]
MIRDFEELELSVKSMGCRKIAIAAAADEDVLKVKDQVEKAGLAVCILVGDKAKILEIAKTLNIEINIDSIIDIPDTVEAAKKAVSLVRLGEADLIMKGHLQTGDFLRAVLDKEVGLRTNRLLSQVTVCQKPDGDGLMLITDCAMNIAPDINGKKMILENAVELALKLDIQKPKVALLCAVEMVNLDMPDTTDAAILSKMAERGQIKNAQVDGPLALDNAMSLISAAHKGIDSPVAGRADILVVPNINVGNALHKSLLFFAGKSIASVVMGAKVPIIMTSRADSPETKYLSVALSGYIAKNS